MKNGVVYNSIEISTDIMNMMSVNGKLTCSFQ